MTTQPRPEHPRPQCVRDTWINLNGPWTCRFDHGNSGREQGFHSSGGFDTGIVVPFCPESSLSGLRHVDFISAIWYHRPIVAPDAWSGKRILLHFGGVDYECEAWIDGKRAGIHYGGTVSFTFDITGLVRCGERHNLVVCARDNLRGDRQPAGKQSNQYRSYGCKYTRVTGIWQTVWLEAVDPAGIAGLQILPDLKGEAFHCIPTYIGYRDNCMLQIEITGNDGIIDGEYCGVAGVPVPCTVPLARVIPWSPDNPHLYTIRLVVKSGGGEILDTVTSYAGLRSIHSNGNRLFLNGAPLFLRMVLDQGYYPDGIWTAPSDEALRHDIEYAMKAGFNGARLHQKVFEERYHYWADRLGFLTWAESSNWGMDHGAAESARNFLPEWAEIVTRDRNHPSIIAWTPFNETHVDTNRHNHDRMVTDAYRIAKELDPTRPVNGCSGWFQVKSDFYTAHNYQQDPAILRKDLQETGAPGVFINWSEKQMPYEGQPYFIDEFGGTRWVEERDRPKGEQSWGYGTDPLTKEDFYKRLESLIDTVCSFDYISGYCYTQLTDVEQEQNGIYTYDRNTKFDMDRIAAVFSRKPEWKKIP